jgi:Flp pilus assembly pilin Flp
MRLACPNITGFGSTIPREYGLIIALISLAALTAVSRVGNQLANTLNTVSTWMGG